MNVLKSACIKPLSEELTRNAIGILFVLLLSAAIFLCTIISELWLRQFISTQQLRRVTQQKFSVPIAFAEEHVDNKVFGKNVTNGMRDKAQVALTFDADMTQGMKTALEKHEISSSYDRRIIDTLIETKTKATFFMTGMWIEQYPKEAKAIAENDLFELGNHSYSHPSFSGTCYGLEQIGDTLKELQIQKTQTLLHMLTGKENYLFRFPGGCFSEHDLAILGKYHLVSIFWDVVSGDAFGQDAEHIIQKVTQGVQHGSIVVMHLNGAPTAPKTADALPTIIRLLSEKGFHFVTVSELLQ